MTKKLKPYMFYDAHLGSQECATLVFAYDVKQAKVLGWKNWLWGMEFIDARAKWLRGDWSHEMERDEPHVVETIKSQCGGCGCWNVEMTVGLCEGCWECGE